uniref:DNA-directed RNA polymerase omega subunit n=1 Tax=Glaucosphaera vacuolata TaxID=38265 RepID=UPI001FCCE606|nr:DNA-directed RNA polymerase omega subunit [Glaucosphaera vacuolata]UNJ18698.1 DNA-directed RNA polymerase omega subunit [Glaucosphaera vacuolata]
MKINNYSKIDDHCILSKTEQILKNTNNRYQITLQIAQLSKIHKDEEMDIVDDSKMKPIIRTILELSQNYNINQQKSK